MMTECGRMIFISIHALRGEGDDGAFKPYKAHPISIHALRGEGDGKNFCFLHRGHDFNPRPPWGGRRVSLSTEAQNPDISIHALRGEGDNGWTAEVIIHILFQSTPSVGRATR